MDAHKSFDPLDDALRVANQISVDFLGRRLLDDTGEQPGKVQYLAMRPAHGREAVGVGENLGELRIDDPFVVSLVFDYLQSNKGLRLLDQRDCALGSGIVQSVGDRPQPVEAAKEKQVPALEISSNRFRQLPVSATVRGLQGAKRVEDDCDVNRSLKNRCWYRR